MWVNMQYLQYIEQEYLPVATRYWFYCAQGRFIKLKPSRKATMHSIQVYMDIFQRLNIFANSIYIYTSIYIVSYKLLSSSFLVSGSPCAFEMLYSEISTPVKGQSSITSCLDLSHGGTGIPVRSKQSFLRYCCINAFSSFDSLSLVCLFGWLVFNWCSKSCINSFVVWRVSVD